MKFIQEMDRQTRKVDEVDRILEMFEPQKDLERIVAHWREKGANMSDDELREAIGMDFEMLEYDPDTTEGMIQKAMEMLGRA